MSWRVPALAGLATATLLLSSCAHRSKMLVAEEVPSCDAEVESEMTENENVRFEIRAKHLALPQRLSGSATTYVVWVRPLDGDRVPQNVGALRVDKNLAGRFVGSTPFRRFEVLVTPEPQAIATWPTGIRVLSAEIER